MPVASTRGPLAALDRRLADGSERPQLTGWRRLLTEFWWFGVKQARACVFAGVFFLAVFVDQLTDHLLKLYSD